MIETSILDAELPNNYTVSKPIKVTGLPQPQRSLRGHFPNTLPIRG